MLKIGIDCHNLEKERTGVGRYLSNLLHQWSKFEIQNPSPAQILQSKTWMGKSKIKNDLKFILYFHREIPHDEFLENPIFEKKLLKIPFFRPSFLIYFLFLLPLALKKDKVDIAFFPCYMVPVTWWGRSIIVLHDVIFKVYPHFSWRYRIPYLLFSWWGAKKSQAIMTVSEFSKNEIIKYYGVNPEKIFVTPLGVDDKFHGVHSEHSDIIRRLGLYYGIETDFILCLGQIFNRRNVDKVILAFQKIASKYPDFQLLIVGKNRTNPFIDIEKMIKKTNGDLGREAILHIDYAPEEDLAGLYSEAKLSVYLSEYEGFGLPPLESMASGTPVLTTNKTALKESVNEAALIVNDPKNIDEIAQKMEEGLTNENLRQDLIKKGLEQVKKFSWEKCAKQTLDILLADLADSGGLRG